MRRRIAAACLGTAFALLAACSPPARHAALTLFFDGVPPLPPPPQANAKPGAAGPTTSGPRFREHGPYGAKLCNACHVSTASNSYVVPKQELCSHCHEIRIDKAYVHGPIASGGCTTCHDPHSSRYAFLLRGGEGNAFCYRCHEQGEIAANPAHKETDKPCLECHDPHQSDRPHLLR